MPLAARGESDFQERSAEVRPRIVALGPLFWVTLFGWFAIAHGIVGYASGGAGEHRTKGWSLAEFCPRTKARPVPIKLIPVSHLTENYKVRASLKQTLHFRSGEALGGIGCGSHGSHKRVPGPWEQKIKINVSIPGWFEIKRWGIFPMDHLQRNLAMDGKCRTFTDVRYPQRPIYDGTIVRQSSSSALHQKLVLHSDPRSLINLKVIAQILPLMIGNPRVEYTAKNTSDKKNSLPSFPGTQAETREGFEFNPRAIPLCIAILGGFWGGVNLMGNRRVPWSGFAFFGSIVLFVLGLNLLFYGSLY
jgi:hypothetical protein